MSRVINYVPRVAIFLAGVAAAAITLPRRDRSTGVSGTEDLKRCITDLETRLQQRQAADDSRFAQVELRLEEHAALLLDLPSTSQIVEAMEKLLAKTMTSLDDRLSTQAHSIEVLKTTVSQTDSLLEKVLESLDSLQTFAEPAEISEDPLLNRSRI